MEHPELSEAAKRDQIDVPYVRMWAGKASPPHQTNVQVTKRGRAGTMADHHGAAAALFGNPHLLENVLSYIPGREGARSCQLVSRQWCRMHRRVLLERWNEDLEEEKQIELPIMRSVLFLPSPVVEGDIGKAYARKYSLKIARSEDLANPALRNMIEVERLESRGARLVPPETNEVILDLDVFRNLTGWTLNHMALFNSVPNEDGVRGAGITARDHRGRTIGSRHAVYRSIHFPEEGTAFNRPEALSEGFSCMRMDNSGLSWSMKEALMWAEGQTSDATSFPGFVCVARDILWMHNEGYSFTVHESRMRMEIPITFVEGGSIGRPKVVGVTGRVILPLPAIDR